MSDSASHGGACAVVTVDPCITVSDDEVVLTPEVTRALVRCPSCGLSWRDTHTIHGGKCPECNRNVEDIPAVAGPQGSEYHPSGKACTRGRDLAEAAGAHGQPCEAAGVWGGQKDNDEQLVNIGMYCFKVSKIGSDVKL